MRILCVDFVGAGRSLTCCRVLQARQHECVAVGVGTARSAIPHLAMWADKIVLTDPAFAKFIPAADAYKAVVFGVDVGRALEPDCRELEQALADMADKEGL